jgi:hypothetical protein
MESAIDSREDIRTIRGLDSIVLTASFVSRGKVHRVRALWNRQVTVDLAGFQDGGRGRLHVVDPGVVSLRDDPMRGFRPVGRTRHW